MLGIFNVCTDFSACDCIRGLYGHRKEVCTESWHWEKPPLPHRKIEPVSAACRSQGLPTELHPRPKLKILLSTNKQSKKWNTYLLAGWILPVRICTRRLSRSHILADMIQFNRLKHKCFISTIVYLCLQSCLSLESDNFLENLHSVLYCPIKSVILNFYM